MTNQKQHVFFGRLANNHFTSFIEQYQNKKKIIIVDENTHEHCLPFLIPSFDQLSNAEIILLPSGESTKDLIIAENVWSVLTEYEISKKDLIINLGGGVITDIGGFIASCYKRGVDFIHIPTSLLGMVDAAIGGKNGVNFGGYKNHIGVIREPLAVFVDTVFLESLSEKELMNGYAEMIKHALISNKKIYPNILEYASQKKIPPIELIEQNTQVKIDIVTKDLYEKGERKLLNFGHTFGHAIESVFMDGSKISHGHAVAIGMVLESYLSFLLKRIDEKTFLKIEKDILSLYQMPQLTSSQIKKIKQFLRQDKKNTEGKINFTLLNDIGDASFDNFVDEKQINNVFFTYFDKY